MEVFWTVAVTAPLLWAVCFLYLRWLTKRGLSRAQVFGGIWGGGASLDARFVHSVPEVARALVEVGSLYGSWFSQYGDIRPVGGTLVITTGELIWEPALYLGRGRARPFRLSRASIAELAVVAEPPPALVGQRLAVRMVDGGSFSVAITDANGLRRALAPTVT